MKIKDVKICHKWPFRFVEGQGGYFYWINKSATIIGDNVLCEEWLLNVSELQGLSNVCEPFGGAGIVSTIVRNMLNPISHEIYEIDADCLKQLHWLFDGIPGVVIREGDAKETLLTAVSQLYLLDWPGFTVYQYEQWRPQFEAMASHSPRAITFFDTAAAYLHLTRDMYSQFTGHTIATHQDYCYAMSHFFWSKIGYSVTRVAGRAKAYFFMLQPVPVGEIEFFAPVKDGGGFEILAEEETL